MRLMECVRLRVKDVDFAARQITVRDGKGGKDRVTMLPDALAGLLRAHLAVVQAQHAADLAQGLGSVWLPDALARKYPNAATAWGWQYVFPARSISVDPRGGERRRHHVDEKLLQRAIRRAAGEAGIVKPVADPIDPSDTKGFIDRLRPGHAGSTRARLHEADDKLLGCGRVLAEPALERRSVLEVFGLRGHG